LILLVARGGFEPPTPAL